MKLGGTLLNRCQPSVDEGMTKQMEQRIPKLEKGQALGGNNRRLKEGKLVLRGRIFMVDWRIS